MAMRYGKMQHGLWEGWPIRFTDTEAWLFNYRDNKWLSLHPAEAHHHGVLLTRHHFQKRFLNLPPLATARSTAPPLVDWYL